MEAGFQKWPRADRSVTMNHRVSVQSRSRPSEPLERANCRFCRALTGGENGIWTDVPIYETDGFVVTPSLGALVEGWLLVLPREHVVNTSRIAANLRQEFTAIVDRTVAIVADEFGPVTLFEHGPSYDGSRLGCGVDHAHLHVVPLSFNLENVVLSKPDGPEWVARACHIAELPAQSKDYLALSSSGQRTLLAHPDVELSQFFRRRIAETLGRPAQYDYRSYPFLESVAATRHRLLSRSVSVRIKVGARPPSMLAGGVCQLKA